MFWCRGVLGGLDDLKGKKVRVFNNTMRDFLSGVGATAVSMAFAEVVPALNSGVVDCGVTGSLSGNTAGWPEVTKSLYPMSLGWSINVMAVNLPTWNRLDKRVQGFLLEQVKAYEDKMWGTIKKATAEADNCNTGKQPCTMGKLAKITIVPVKPAEAETHKKLVEGAVLAGWAKRCGAECARGVERHRRQGARPEGADSDLEMRRSAREGARDEARCRPIRSQGSRRSRARGRDRRRRDAAARGGDDLHRHHPALCLFADASAAPTSCPAMRSPSRARGASRRRCSVRSHIRIDTRVCRACSARARHARPRRASPAFALFFALVAWHGWGVLQQSYVSGSRSMSALETPLVIPQAMWVVGSRLFRRGRAAAAGARAAAYVTATCARCSRLIGSKSAVAEAEEEIVAVERAIESERKA